MVENHGLEQKVNGVDMMDYMASVLEKNEAQAMELKRVEAANDTLKQMHNHSRLRMKSVELDYKRREIDLKEIRVGR